MPDYLPPRIVILGMGGTIAGSGAQLLRDSQYQAAQLRAAELIAAVPQAALASRGHIVEVRQIAQLDSKDMDDVAWHALAVACRAELARCEVAAVIIPHGTDTLEETAWFLHNTVGIGKPVVLTAAMRAADALSADGPANLRDALLCASARSARVRAQRGWHVMCVLAGRIHAAAQVQKIHPQRVDAFSSGEAGPLGWIEDGRLRWSQPVSEPSANLGPKEHFISSGFEGWFDEQAITQALDNRTIFYPQGAELVVAPQAGPANTSPTFEAIHAAQTTPQVPQGLAVDVDLRAGKKPFLNSENYEQNQSTDNPPQAQQMRQFDLMAPEHWPWVAVLTSHAGARAATVNALVAAGVRGLIVAGTGNATVHQAWLPALARAHAAGVVVRRCSRCVAASAISLGDAVDEDEIEHLTISTTYIKERERDLPKSPSNKKAVLGRGLSTQPIAAFSEQNALPRIETVREQARATEALTTAVLSASLPPFDPFYLPENIQNDLRKRKNSKTGNIPFCMDLFPALPLSATKARISVMLEIMLADLQKNHS